MSRGVKNLKEYHTRNIVHQMKNTTNIEIKTFLPQEFSEQRFFQKKATTLLQK